MKLGIAHGRRARILTDEGWAESNAAAMGGDKFTGCTTKGD